jgi:hypothetical protein
VGAAQELTRAVQTLAVVASYVLLLANEPPFGSEWHDTHFQVGMLLGAVVAVDSIALLQRRRLSPPALAWISLLTFAGLVLSLSCWLQLGVRTFS